MDIEAGQLVLEAGTILHPAEIGLLATIGRAEVRVYPLPRIGIMSTGDEIVEPGPVLDPTHLERLRQLDDHDDFLRGLIRDFITDAEQLVDELEVAALDRDAATFRDRAHALRSSAAHIGATAVFELCHEWRGIGPDDLAAEGADYATRLKSEFERLRLALLAELVAPQPDRQSVSSRPH
jgi:two-component system sensor histidine kinase RpfC